MSKELPAERIEDDLDYNPVLPVRTYQANVAFVRIEPMPPPLVITGIVANQHGTTDLLFGLWTDVQGPQFEFRMAADVALATAQTIVAAVKDNKDNNGKAH